MTIKASDFRVAGRQYARDKARREHTALVDRLYDEAMAAYAAWAQSLSDDDHAILRAAEQALREVDPGNSYFS